MQRFHLTISVLTVVALATAGCGPAVSAGPPAATSPAATSPATSPVASPAATSTAVQAAASPSAIAIAVERVDGTVRTLADGTLVLTSGRSISVPASVIVVRSTVGSAADLHPGDYVAITGVRQPDNTLLASIVTVFPPSLGQVAPGQRPLPQGNLMTNATIDQVQGNSFTVSFPGGGAQVQLAPGAQVTRLVDAGISDVHPGDQVSVQVVDGTARLLTIESSSTQQP